MQMIRIRIFDLDQVCLLAHARAAAAKIRNRHTHLSLQIAGFSLLGAMRRGRRLDHPRQCGAR